MRQYKDVLRDIDEMLSHIEETKNDIEDEKRMVAQIKSDLDSADGPGLGAYRQSLIEDIRDRKSSLEWLYDEKEISYVRLKDLKSEKARFEDPKWKQKPCKTPNCDNDVWYRVDWEHAPNYCSECKQSFRKTL